MISFFDDDFSGFSICCGSLNRREFRTHISLYLSPHMGSWFKDYFGFEEPRPNLIKSFVHLDDDDPEDPTLIIGPKRKRIHIGKFEILSSLDLRGLINENPTSEAGATYDNVSGSVTSFHGGKSTSSTVIQAASQFNCLEMVGPSVRPDAGITNYFRDRTQGPACALACPGGTLYRNYFWNGGRGQCGNDSNQIDTAKRVGEILGNDTNKYWEMKNGYLIPGKGKMAELGARLNADAELQDRIVDNFSVGVHWNTETKADSSKRICQVYASAVPVSYAKDTKVSDWACFAKLNLRGQYMATMLTAVKLQRIRGGRITVYLTQLGGGVFGNQTSWILDAIEAAVIAVKDEPLDIRLVHYSPISKSNRFVDLKLKLEEEGIRRNR